MRWDIDKTYSNADRNTTNPGLARARYEAFKKKFGTNKSIYLLAMVTSLDSVVWIPFHASDALLQSCRRINGDTGERIYTVDKLDPNDGPDIITGQSNLIPHPH